jgi:DNA-binding transcriptional MerR regulator
MFQIGEFSRLARVTIETLRHYDAIGLLKLAHVEPTTGYRYYQAGQLQPLNQILAFKEMGLSLEDIARIITENLPEAEIRAMLSAQLAAAERALEAAEYRRQRILSRLQSPDRSLLIPEYDVSLQSAEALLVASLRERIPTAADIPRRWEAMFASIAAWLGVHRLPIGIPMAFYHDEGYVIEQIDTECAFAIPGRAPQTLPAPPGPMLLRQVDAIPRAATLVAAGVQMQVGGLKAAYAALGEWIAHHGYHIGGAPRERYHGAPGTQDFTVEIQIPVERSWRA